MDLSVKTVFLAPTVSLLAAELEAARGAAVPGTEGPAPERKDPV